MKAQSGRSPRPLCNSSPPSYHEATNPNLIIAETTTTTEVVTTTTRTTQTTTHFFPSPPWKNRRNLLPSSHPSTSTPSTSENGIVWSSAMSSVLRLDKALPPTPPDIDHPFSNSHQQQAPVCDSNLAGTARSSDAEESSRASEHPPSLSRKSSVPFSTRPIPHATSALARASLGVGLPHVMPQVATTPSLEINTVAFITSTPSPSTSLPQLSSSHLSAVHLRRPRNVQRPTIKSSYEASFEMDRGALENRRGRGLSLSNTLFNLGNALKKEKDAQDAVSPRSAFRSLSRRPSLWFRRKNEPAAETTSLPVSPLIVDVEPLPLPEVHPVSPFDLDLTFSSTAEKSNVRHARKLSRSLSERVGIHTSLTANGTAEDGLITKSQCPLKSDSVDFPTLDISSCSPSLSSHPLNLHSCPPRPRAYTNPLLLNRLSTNLLPPSLPSATSPSATSATSPSSLFNPIVAEVTKPRVDEELSEIYLNRLTATVRKADIATILASSGDTFHLHALRSHLEQFNFKGDPLDVALRKLLMDVSLPRETQQIDRVIESFAGQYMLCNPNLFTSDDQPYVLAFSLIMLHTDAFNKANKRKMTKADYIKNTRLPGVATEVLDCFYDNIVFAPFIFIEDHVDVNGQHGLLNERTPTRMLANLGTPTFNSSRVNVALPSKGNKIDPYYLITHNLLDPLRVNVEKYVPMENPYSYEGSSGSWNTKELQQVFARARAIEIASGDSQRNASFALNLGHAFVPHTDPPSATIDDVWTLKVAKSGVLNRKDDVLEGGKKATGRKWKSWNVILTGSQLLLFRDPTWAAQLLASSRQRNGQVILPEASIFKPEELLTMRDAIAIFDRSDTKHVNTMRFVMRDGRHILLQAPNENELNEWISCINYASAFKSAGLRMRALGMSSQEFEMTGVAAATSHLHDTQHSHTAVEGWDTDAPHHLMDMLTGATSSSTRVPPSSRRFTVMASLEAFDFESPVPLETEGTEQFKATFEEVKAQLASGSWRMDSSTAEPIFCDEPIPASPVSSKGENKRPPLRSEIIRTTVRELDSKISLSQTQLDSYLRFVRNIATLVPFRKSTRDRLEGAVREIAQKVMQVRLDMARLICHREVLSNDLEMARRDLHRAKSMALKAATETLQGQEEHTIPRMTLSFNNLQEDISLSQSISLTRESSRCESFHSALDFGPEWPSTSEDMGSSGLLGTTPFEFATRCSSSSSMSLRSDTAPRGDKPIVVEDNARIISDDHESRDKFELGRESTDEQAEEWNKTRAAQRVSLVRLPSTVRMSTLFEKYARPTAIPG